MGPERLSRALLVVATLVLAACGSKPTTTLSPVAPSPPRHVQIARAKPTAERLALVEKLKARNEPGWEVNDAALTGITVVDPFAGFLRRARRASAYPPAATPVKEADAAAAARAFVSKNFDLLGFPRHVALSLAETVHASGTGWTVRFDALYPAKGYEAFFTVENKVELDVVVEDDGIVSRFENRSIIHPPLFLDTKPLLAEDDGRLYAKLLGRRVFALLEDGSGTQGKLELGVLERKDFVHAKLVIHPTTGPLFAWTTYRLAYLVGAAKETEGTKAFFFFWVVDADTGDVIADAVPPVVYDAPP